MIDLARMPFARALLLSCCTAGLLLAQPAPKKQFTARELFYAAPQAPPTSQPPAKGSPHKSSKSSKAAAKNAVEIATAAPPPSTPTASLTAGGEPPLGLRYTVQRFTSGGAVIDVPSDTVFHSGDHIRFSVETNAPGYLFVVNRGSSGTWKLMFPAPEIADGNNRVEPMRQYAMPPGDGMFFTFDSNAGAENAFIVFSRKPEPDLEGLIYSLQGKKKAAAPEAPVQSSKELIQSVNIPNNTVDRMRTAWSRDLIIERVDPNTPGDQKETAVYVVNPTGSADSRVVADIHLVHQ
jgi:hypothetical protein